MRQVMPHRNNIGGASRSCKSFLPPLGRLSPKALLADERRRPERDAVSRKECIKSATYGVNLRMTGGRAAARGDGRYAKLACVRTRFEARTMTAVDFAAFVDRLAQLSGEVILPYFRSAIGAEDKSRGGAFDPVTEADRLPAASRPRRRAGVAQS